METKNIASFIIRIQLSEKLEESEDRNWRIRVTHVQEDEENLFTSIEDACHYMKKSVEDEG